MEGFGMTGAPSGGGGGSPSAPPGTIIMMADINKGFDLRTSSSSYPDLVGQYGLSPMLDCPNKSTMQGTAITTKCPAGYLLADGSTLNIADYPALYGVIGQTYGYNSANRYKTFNLPDFRGRFLRMSGGDAAARGTAQADGIKAHNHNFNYNDDSISTSSSTAPGGDSTFFLTNNVISKTTTNRSGTTLDNTNASLETRPVNYSVLYYIRY